MKVRLFALAAALWVGCGGASATMSCSVVTPTFTWTYNSAGLSTAQSNVTFTCNRGSAGDSSNVAYEAEILNDGSSPTGSTNRATLGGATILYDLYTDSSCSTLWAKPQGTITWTTTGTKTGTIPVWACASGQGGKPLGTYTDSVQGRFRADSLDVTSNVPVSIQVPGVCTVSAPAALNFNYTAFGPLVNSSTTFAVNCNSGMSYSMAVTPTSGTVAGLDYLLSVNTASQTGTGAAQTQTINGTMAADQAGSCAGSCSGSQPHTVTISY